MKPLLSNAADTNAPDNAFYSAKRQNLSIAVLAFAGLGNAFMQTILIPIQGKLPELLGASPADTAWVITITLLVSAISTPIAGKLGDMYGKWRVAIILMCITVAASVVCALSSSLLPLVVGRALQGLGAGIIPLGISMLRDIVDRHRLGTAVALISATLGVGGAIGLPISALVTERLDWHMLFVFASVISLTALVLIVLVVPKGRPGTGGRVDFAGAIGLTVGLSGILLGISQGNNWGWTSGPILTSLAVGTIALIACAIYQWKATHPLVNLRVSIKPAVLSTNLASVAMGFALFASSVAFPQFLQLPVDKGGLGMDLLGASLMLVPSGVAMLLMSPVAGRMQQSLGPRALLIAGAIVLAVAYLVCLILPLGAWQIFLVNGVIGVGIGLGYAAMPALIMSAVPREETAAANGLNTLMRALGTTIAAACVGAILAASAGANQTDAFWLVFLLGLLSSALCAGVGTLIPRSQKEAALV